MNRLSSRLRFSALFLPTIFTWVSIFGCSALLASGLAAAQPDGRSVLKIYFIDVEGGQSTLIVTPDRHALLVDTGWAGAGAGYVPGEPLRQLVCPRALIGPVDVYLISHHGGGDAWYPAVSAGLKPRVAIINNGLHKGGARNTFETLHRAYEHPDVWQLHPSERAAELNFPPEFIANLDENTAHWIKVTARKDGSFEVSNGRTGESKRYAPLH